MGGKQSFPVVELPHNRVVVITGANTGLGYEAAKWVAMMGATVIMTCRSKERAEKAMQKIQDEFQVEKEKGTPAICKLEKLSMEFMELDLGSFKSVRSFIKAYQSSGRELHVLVCNAGVALVPFTKTEDGYEVMLQIMQMHSMQKRLKGTNVSINSLHPGMVDTEIARNFQDFHLMKAFNSVTRLFGCVQVAQSSDAKFNQEMSSDAIIDRCTKNNGANEDIPIDGALPIINAVVNPDLKGVGGSTLKASMAGIQQQKLDETNQEALWKKTLEVLKDEIPEDLIQELEGKM